MARFRRGRRLTARQDSFAAAEKAFPVKHDDSAAFAATDFDIRACAYDSPFAGAAGMRLAGSDDVTNEDLFRHETEPPFN